MTWLIVVQTPGLNVVLGELGVGEKQHGGGDQLHVVLVKLLQLQLHPAHLGSTAGWQCNATSSLQYFNLNEVGLNTFGVKLCLLCCVCLRKSKENKSKVNL